MLHLIRMLPGCFWLGFPGTSHWEETPGETLNVLEGLCIFSGLGRPRGPAGGAGEDRWGGGGLGFVLELLPP